MRRRAWLPTAALSIAGCVRARDGIAGVVAFPERSLAYAPLLLALQDGSVVSPPARVVPLLRAGGTRVAAAVVSGEADAGALPLEDFVEAAASGAPLLAIGALTRRLGGQLVVSAAEARSGRDPAGLLAGAWRAMPFGLQTGSEGTERAMRFWWLAAGRPPPVSLLAGDPLAGEPRWIGYGTDAGLVAALKDGRIAAYLGRSQAAAQTTILGGGQIVANLSDGSVAPDVTSALCTVLVATQQRVATTDGDGGRFLRALVAGCGRAAASLAGPDGPALAARALPERDPLALGVALRLDTPSPDRSVYATDGRLPARTITRYLELASLAGRALAVDPAALATDRFAG